MNQPRRATVAHLDELLDEALKETFPASDPVAIDVEREPPQHEATTMRGTRGGKQGAAKA
jgi:hypothetical protein